MQAFLADSESVASALVARDGRILESNRTFQRLLMSTGSIHEVVVPGQTEIMVDLIAHAGPDWHTGQAGLRREDRDPVDCKLWALAQRDHVLVLAEELHAPGENLYALLLELNDDLLKAGRELAAQNRRLRELDELKTMFLASATHDLQQPLTSLLAYAELLGEQSLPPEARRMTNVIEKNAQRMTVMINDLLGAASIMTGELRLERRWTDLGGLVRTAMDAIQPAATAGRVVVTRSGPESIVARVDERRVMQILDNLLSNAVKYCPDGGEVDVDCAVDDDTITIAITDTGIGIPLAEQEHLFDRYFRASTALGHGIAGTGLGLANARAFAEAHGGRLTCDSVPGAGSTFTLTLPDPLVP